jgi:hypothetical protein
MKCCTLVGSVSPSEAASCTSTAQSGNQSSCQSFIAAIEMVAPQLGSYCQ